MSVAVQQSPGLPFARGHRAQQSPRSHPRPAQPNSTPGLIRLPVFKQPPQSPPRVSRPRNRKADKGKAVGSPFDDKVDGETDVPSEKDKDRKQSPPPQYKDKEQLPKYSGRKPATRRSASHVPKSRNKFSQAETTSSPSPSDSESPSIPITPSPRKTSPAAVVDAAPTGRLARSRRSKNASPPVVIPTADPPAYSSLSRSVPNASVPVLPDWDSPPQASAPWNSAPPSPTEPEGPISWMETFGDDTVPVAPKAPVRPFAVAQIQFPTGPPSPPRRSARPVGRHNRTASTPSLSLALMARDEEDRPMYTPDGKLIKYAGSRFQSAPAPTFIPMPSFAA